jgi:hypothetical protein
VLVRWPAVSERAAVGGPTPGEALPSCTLPRRSLTCAQFSLLLARLQILDRVAAPSCGLFTGAVLPVSAASVSQLRRHINLRRDESITVGCRLPPRRIVPHRCGGLPLQPMRDVTAVSVANSVRAEGADTGARWKEIAPTAAASSEASSRISLSFSSSGPPRVRLFGRPRILILTTSRDMQLLIRLDEIAPSATELHIPQELDRQSMPSPSDWRLPHGLKILTIEPSVRRSFNQWEASTISLPTC